MSYKINSKTGELGEYTFDFGGIVMLRNFNARVDGERLIVHSSENQNFSILDALVSEVEIDGVIYDNPTEAQEVLQRLVFNADTPALLPQEERNLIKTIKDKSDKNHNHTDLYYSKKEVLDLTNKTPLMTPLTNFKTTKIFTDAGSNDVQYGNTTLLMNPGENHTIEVVKEGTRKIFRYVKLDDGEVNFTSSTGDIGGDFVVEYTTSDTVLKKGGEAIVVLNGANAWITIRNNDRNNQDIDNLQIGGENLISGGRHFVRTGVTGVIFSEI